MSSIREWMKMSDGGSADKSLTLHINWKYSPQHCSFCSVKECNVIYYTSFDANYATVNLHHHHTAYGGAEC